MKNILTPVVIVSLGILLQACVAIPAPTTNSTGDPKDFRQKYAGRFSVDGVQQQREQQYAQKLAALKRINPIEDAQRAAAADDYYYLTYQSGRGGSQIVPGLTQQQSQSSRCGSKQLDGMGDAIFGKNHQQYRDAIRHYANQFNRTMFAFCR